MPLPSKSSETKGSGTNLTGDSQRLLPSTFLGDIPTTGEGPALDHQSSRTQGFPTAFVNGTTSASSLFPYLSVKDGAKKIFSLYYFRAGSLMGNIIKPSKLIFIASLKIISVI